MGRRQTVTFNPKRLPLSDTTLARQVAKQNLTTLNHALWVTEHSHALVKSSFGKIPIPTGVGAHGSYGTAAAWAAAADEQRLWVRQHVLVSAASLLEVYLASAMAAALWASPEYADRSLAGVSEVELIKFPDRAPWLDKLIRQHVKGMLKDQWTVRFREMAVVFGRLPPALTALAPELQGLQNRRNLIAHSFGQDSKATRRTPWDPTNSMQLNVTDAEQALKCVSKAIREADQKVFGPVIGGYELLYEYHAWLSTFNDFSRPGPDVRRLRFRQYVGSRFGHVPEKVYFRGLVQYYEACI